MPDSSVHINHSGFREYDARWIYPKDINLAGIKDLGHGLGTQIITETRKQNPRVIVGYDYRSYSEEIKNSLAEGLISSGCYVEDLGLSLSPMTYFAQFELNADAVAMVTASHNENGWTGVKMGIKKGLTHAPEEMAELKKIVLNKQFINGQGKLKKIENFISKYKENLIRNNKIKKKIKAVVACGNGTAGIFAPDILRGIGCEVIEMDCNLDFNFPKYNPNPEDLKMLRAISKTVKDNKADIGFGFDGDGDRVIAASSDGSILDGDYLLFICSEDRFDRGLLKNSSVVITPMANLGMREAFYNLGIPLHEVSVGDRNILQALEENNWLIGGEQSGHIIFRDLSTTGDGVLTSVQTLLALLRKHRSSVEASTVFSKVPQVLKNVFVENDAEKIVEEIKDEVNVASMELGKGGRVLVRPSGTGPLVRVMVETRDSALASSIAEHLSEIIKRKDDLLSAAANNT